MPDLRHIVVSRKRWLFVRDPFACNARNPICRRPIDRRGGILAASLWRKNFRWFFPTSLHIVGGAIVGLIGPMRVSISWKSRNAGKIVTNSDR